MILFELFITFFKIGLFTIGGGYAMIPLIQSEVVAKNWIVADELINFIAIAESTPGPFAVNIATFVGMESAGIIGGLCATLGVVLPSFVIILFIAKYFHTFSQNRIVRSALLGLRPTVIGLMLSVVFSIAVANFFTGLDQIAGVKEFFMTNINYKGIVIFAVLFILSKKIKLHPILLIVLSAALGMLLYGVLPF